MKVKKTKLSSTGISPGYVAINCQQVKVEVENSLQESLKEVNNEGQVDNTEAVIAMLTTSISPSQLHLIFTEIFVILLTAENKSKKCQHEISSL